MSVIRTATAIIDTKRVVYWNSATEVSAMVGVNCCKAKMWKSKHKNEKTEEVKKTRTWEKLMLRYGFEEVSH